MVTTMWLANAGVNYLHIPWQAGLTVTLIAAAGIALHARTKL